MEELKTYKIIPNEDNMQNALTIEMDEYIMYPISFLETYILPKHNNGFETTYAIRYPGATRGSIFVDENNIITKIVLNDTACDHPAVKCYKPEVKEILKKYIGMKIVEE